MSGRDIVVLSLYKSSSAYSNTIDSIAREWARNNRIFFIDNPSSVKDYVFRSNEPYFKRYKSSFLYGKVNWFEDSEAGFTRVIVPLILPINWLPKGWIYKLFRRFNQRLLNRTIQRLIEAKNLKEYVYINSFNPLYDTISNQRFRPSVFIYNSVDNIEESKFIRKHGSYLEGEVMRKSNFVVTTSSELKKKASLYKDEKDVHLVPNGANYKLFSRAGEIHMDKPDELLNTGDQKIVVYVGNIDHRTDYEIIQKLLDSEKLLLLMIGPLGSNDLKDRGLINHDRLLYIGPKPIADLPKYLRYSDCAIIPFVCNELTGSIYPLKVNEYLAAATGVVSTNFSRDINEFRDVIHIAENPDEFLGKVLTVCSQSENGVTEERLAELYQSVASKNTWENRAKMFADLIDGYSNLPT